MYTAKELDIPYLEITIVGDKFDKEKFNHTILHSLGLL